MCLVILRQSSQVAGTFLVSGLPPIEPALCSFEWLLLRRVNGRCQERLVKDVIYCIRSALLVRGLLGKNAVRWLANKMWRD